MNRFLINISHMASDACYGCDQYGNICNWGAGSGQASQDNSYHTAPTPGCYNCDAAGNVCHRGYEAHREETLLRGSGSSSRDGHSSSDSLSSEPSNTIGDYKALKAIAISIPILCLIAGYIIGNRIQTFDRLLAENTGILSLVIKLSPMAMLAASILAIVAAYGQIDDGNIFSGLAYCIIPGLCMLLSPTFFAFPCLLFLSFAEYQRRNFCTEHTPAVFCIVAFLTGNALSVWIFSETGRIRFLSELLTGLDLPEALLAVRICLFALGAAATVLMYCFTYKAVSSEHLREVVLAVIPFAALMLVAPLAGAPLAFLYSLILLLIKDSKGLLRKTLLLSAAVVVCILLGFLFLRHDRTTEPVPFSSGELETVIAQTELPYSDVPDGSWYTDAVKFTYAYKLMDAVSKDSFAPDEEMSRAMFATALWSFAGKPTATEDNPFSDVLMDRWYTTPILWAAENGIVAKGDSFRPFDAVTRSECLIILYHYTELKGFDTAAASDLSGFADDDTISDFLEVVFSWAVANRLITGIEVNGAFTLQPNMNINRAQAAFLLLQYARFLQE